MIGKLKNIFPSLRFYAPDKDIYDDKYQWFLTDEQEIIGIANDELSTKELSLLKTFLTPYNIKFPPPNPNEKKWIEMIKDEKIHYPIPGHYRFVYFSLRYSDIDPIPFKEAIQELFPKDVPIIWENEYEGVMIEIQENDQEPVTYEQIIDVLMSDLYGKIYFYVGPFQDNVDHVRDYYFSMIKGAKTALQYSTKSVMTYTESVPFLLIDQLDADVKTNIAEFILQDFMNDKETLKMIETFVECNLNISETAKELYMHRNSLQYRLDRFQKKTGIDIRQFHEAMTVYLAVIAHKK